MLLNGHKTFDPTAKDPPSASTRSASGITGRQQVGGPNSAGRAVSKERGLAVIASCPLRTSNRKHRWIRQHRLDQTGRSACAWHACRRWDKAPSVGAMYRPTPQGLSRERSANGGNAHLLVYGMNNAPLAVRASIRRAEQEHSHAAHNLRRSPRLGHLDRHTNLQRGRRAAATSGDIRTAGSDPGYNRCHQRFLKSTAVPHAK